MGQTQTHPRVFLLCCGSLYDYNFVSHQRNWLLRNTFHASNVPIFLYDPQCNSHACRHGRSNPCFHSNVRYIGPLQICSIWVGLSSPPSFPVQIFGITYHRDPFVENVRCKGRVLHVNELRRRPFSWSIRHESRVSCEASNLSNFVRRVLTQGLLYFIVVFLVNLWVVLEFIGVFSTGAASTMPLAIVLIAVQHLILNTQHLTPDNDTHFSSSL
ncbi:hypothetical protein B0H11DRAFT_2189068 [Mycena galericulata]|nr:hypothetical protein B0H11DRAFT_2189068 [Mycena galericulata]